MMDVFLYNPKSQRDKGEKVIKKITQKWNKPYQLYNVLVTDKVKLFQTLDETDRIIMVGGDGTIHHLANDIRNYDLKQEVFLIAGGTGNDFKKSLKTKDHLLNITKYIKNLPTVSFDETDRVFVNGCGIGLDGFVCEIVNGCQKKGRFTFFRSTLKGFRKYKPFDATITVDDKKYQFKKVYLASIMNGSYEGGGMKMSPNSVRLDDKIEICVVHRLRKLSLLLSFPLIYFGKHTLKKKSVIILEGKQISIESDRNTYIQIDGEDAKEIRYLKAER